MFHDCLNITDSNEIILNHFICDQVTICLDTAGPFPQLVLTVCWLIFVSWYCRVVH